jgi:hypothetical protein
MLLTMLLLTHNAAADNAHIFLFLFIRQYDRRSSWADARGNKHQKGQWRRYTRLVIGRLYRCGCLIPCSRLKESGDGAMLLMLPVLAMLLMLPVLAMLDRVEVGATAEVGAAAKHRLQKALSSRTSLIVSRRL